jgi:hypothetical protein
MCASLWWCYAVVVVLLWLFLIVASGATAFVETSPEGDKPCSRHNGKHDEEIAMCVYR